MIITTATKNQVNTRSTFWFSRSSRRYEHAEHRTPPTRPRFRLSCRLHRFAQDMTGCAAMSCDSQQASRQPLPRPTPRLRPPAGQRFAPPPQAILACSRPPQGAPFSLRAIGGLALRCETASALRLCTLQAPRTRRDLASLGRARNGADVNRAFLPPGRAGRPLRGDRPVPPARGTFPFPGSGRPHYVRTAGSSGVAAGFATAKPADAPLACSLVRPTAA